MTGETVVKEQKIDNNKIYPPLFDFGLKALIKAKSDMLLEIRQLELELLNAKYDLAEKERNLLLTTDFKGLGLTNEKMRNAYVNEKLNDHRAKMDVKKHSVTSKKDTLELINDLIRLNELELQGE